MLAGIEWDQGHYCFVERVETGRRGLTGPGLGGTGQIGTGWDEEKLLTGTA